VVSWLAALAAAALLPGFNPAPSQPSSGGTLLTGTFPGTLRPGLVYLPPGYSPALRYPVVYLLHGMPGSPSEFVDGVDLAGWAAAAVEAGIVRPFIAVMPAAGPDHRYNGEWAGRWEKALVALVVPWVDAHLATIRTAAGRVLAGLSAGGYGAVDIGLRHPSLFGSVESWSGYFAPLRDGPFKHATKALFAAHDPVLLARSDARTLRRDGIRFFVSSGPYHSHWFRPAASAAFARELQSLRIPVRYRYYGASSGEWRAQADAGLAWAFGLPHPGRRLYVGLTAP
jgi:enterochelin esterase-like enzyme